MRETLRVLQATDATNVAHSLRLTFCRPIGQASRYCDVTHLLDGDARAIDSGVAVVDDDGVDDDALARHEAATVDAEVSSDEARVEAAAGDT